jgi:hypothetical protein
VFDQNIDEKMGIMGNGTRVLCLLVREGRLSKDFTIYEQLQGQLGHYILLYLLRNLRKGKAQVLSSFFAVLIGFVRKMLLILILLVFTELALF